jgi:hypothetical protein
MRKSRLIFNTIILTLVFGSVFGHQDFWVIRDYGNIKVRVKSGFDYEEINKAFIIGQLAQALVKDLGYSDQIFLDFNHYYTGDCEPDYFISFDDGQIKYPWDDYTEKNLLKGKAIVLRQVAKTFDVISSLKLLEYSVANIEMVKSIQRQIEYNQNYCEWTINSVDTVLIDKQVSRDMSPLIAKIFKLKIERPDKDFKNGISYYWQAGKYYIYHRKVGQEDKVALVLTSIYDFQKIDPNTNLIFDSDRAFYCLTADKDVVVSKRHELLDTSFEYWRPYRVTKISDNKLSFYLSGFGTSERTLLYTISSDELEQGQKK